MCHIADLADYGASLLRWTEQRAGILLSIRQTTGGRAWLPRRKVQKHERVQLLRKKLFHLEECRPVPPD